MITTPDLIDTLATNPPRVRRIYAPSTRLISWTVLAVAILSFLWVSQGLRADLATKFAEPSYATSIVAALLTGLFGAHAAFLVSLPDRSRLWLLLPMPFAVIWLSSIGYQCLFNWVDLGPESMRVDEIARCFATMLITSLPLSLALIVMLRHAALLRPTSVTFVGSLAVSGITAAAMSLYHVLDASLMILAWNLGVAMVILICGKAYGPKVLRLVAPRAPLDR